MEDKLFWAAIALLALVILWAAWRYWRFYQREHFTCPQCGHRWKPPLGQMVFSVNAVEGKVLHCPHCGEKVYVEPVKDR